MIVRTIIVNCWFGSDYETIIDAEQKENQDLWWRFGEKIRDFETNQDLIGFGSHIHVNHTYTLTRITQKRYGRINHMLSIISKFHFSFMDQNQSLARNKLKILHATKSKQIQNKFVEILTKSLVKSWPNLGKYWPLFVSINYSYHLEVRSQYISIQITEPQGGKWYLQ